MPLATNGAIQVNSMTNELQFIKGNKHEIFIGIKDKDSYEEILTTEDFVKILTAICTEKNICFTMFKQYGGYTHNKGYTTETSLRVLIIGAEDDEIQALGETLKKEINTDTILITKSEIEYVFA